MFFLLDDDHQVHPRVDSAVEMVGSCLFFPHADRKQMRTRTLGRCIHAHALPLASLLQSNNLFCKDDGTVVHLDESVVYGPLLNRCFQAFPEKRM